MNKKDLFELIVRNTVEVLPELASHSFMPDDKLIDLGANSVDRAEIITITMEALSLQIPPNQFLGAKNIGELVDVFYKKLQSA
jgi:polyketide biosynthesis acyl carrier protein